MADRGDRRQAWGPVTSPRGQIQMPFDAAQAVDVPRQDVDVALVAIDHLGDMVELGFWSSRPRMTPPSD